ncbi:MAG: GNAT family N-acetyltransferase [Clostridia bacterium]|nr:GNAT family N-acetyltransferase [Clostridia bacterium]
MKKESIYRIFSKIPTLETERLILRKMLVSDKEDIYAYSCREDVTEYLTWAPHTSIAYTQDYLRYIGQRYSVGDYFDWAVVEKKSGRVIGSCGFTRFDYPNDAGEIGYVFHPDFGGQGYATEAVGEVVRFGFVALKLHRIEARYLKGNDRSCRLMERLAMRFEGERREAMLVKGAYRTVGTYSILTSEYQRKQ